MSPIFYEDSLGAKLVEKAKAAMDAARDAEDEYVDDPESLARAEDEARGVDPQRTYEAVTADWVVVFGPSKLSGLTDEAGVTSHLLTAPLEAADIPFAWDPYPPEAMPTYRFAYGAMDRPFRLLVPSEHRPEARALLGSAVGSESLIGLPVALPHSEQSKRARQRRIWVLVLVLFGFDMVAGAVYSILKWLGIL